MDVQSLKIEFHVDFLISPLLLFLSLRMDQTRETETKAFFVSSYLFFPWKLYTKILLCGNVCDMLLSILILFKMTFVFHATAHLPCFKRLNCLFLHSQSNYILLKFLSSSALFYLFILVYILSLHTDYYFLQTLFLLGGNFCISFVNPEIAATYVNM